MERKASPRGWQQWQMIEQYMAASTWQQRTSCLTRMLQTALNCRAQAEGGAGCQYSSQKMWWRRQLSGCVAVSSGSVWLCGGLLGTSCTRTHSVDGKRTCFIALLTYCFGLGCHNTLTPARIPRLSLSLSLSQINCFLTNFSPH